MVNDNLFPHEVIIRHGVTHSGKDLHFAVQFMDFVHSMFGETCVFVLDRKRYSEDGHIVFYWRFQNLQEAMAAKLAWHG